jgi:hypothetical protein
MSKEDMSEIHKGDWERAKKLWKILDDIDTLSDQIKPTSMKLGSHAVFYNLTMERVAKRHDILHSDGYNLTRI